MKRQRIFIWLMTLLVSALSLSAQEYVLKGVVEDTSGEPLAGATVLKRGTTAGVSTDIDGNFQIDVTKGDVITVSYIGCDPKEINVDGQNDIKVVMSESSALLEEVVVVGYGTMRKKDLTGSVVQINASKLADQNPGTVQDLLRGTPGLQIGYDPSAKGGDASIQLRGQNSLYTEGNHNSPLIILDGMQYYGELSEINPDDIGQIDVLKDASSAAIYGAKAASGVLIITTKKGKEGKPTVTLSANLGVSHKAGFQKMYSADEYMKYREDWYKATTYGYDENGNWGYYGTEHGVPKGYYDHYSNAGLYGLTPEQWAQSGAMTLGPNDTMESLYATRLGLGAAPLVYDNYLKGRSHDWMKDTFRTGFSQDYNASISGATDRVNYYASFGFLKNQGIIRGDDYRSYRASLKVNTKITNWLEMGVHANFQDRTDGTISAPYKTGSYDKNNKTMFFNSPYSTPYDEEGNLLQYPMSGNSNNSGINWMFTSPYEKLDRGYTVLNTIYTAKVTLPLGFTYQFNIAPRFQWYHDYYWTSAEMPNTTPETRGANRKSARDFDWNLNNTITWDRTFLNKHHFTVTLVQEAEENRHYSDELETYGLLPSDALGFGYVEVADKSLSKFKNTDTHTTASAYLGRLFYSFDNRYMTTLSVRRDGYSAFGQNNPWATFWSAGASWRLSQEKWFNGIEWLDDAKLRVSYGTNGNRSLKDPYMALSHLTLGNRYAYIQGDKVIITNGLNLDPKDGLGNPNLEWEKTSAWNIGLDFSFLNSRISGSIEWYSKKTKDMIMFQRLPEITGFERMGTNLGEVQNRGIEITVNATPIISRNFTWDLSAGFSYNKNKIVHLYGDIDPETGEERNDKSNNWFIGQPIGTIWAYETDGIWQIDEAEQAAKVGQKPGDPKVVNHYTADDYPDGTPRYTEDDKVYLGTTNPPIYWNLRNEFTLWKNFTFSFSMYSYMGHKSRETYFMNGDNAGSMVTYCYNMFKKPDYWTPDNPTNDYARLDAKGPNGIETEVGKIYNRSFVRLDNITIGYTIPQQWTRRFAVERLRVTASCNNVCTISGWKYGDPETTQPAVRQFNFGLNVTF